MVLASDSHGLQLLDFVRAQNVGQPAQRPPDIHLSRQNPPSPAREPSGGSGSGTKGGPGSPPKRAVRLERSATKSPGLAAQPRIRTGIGTGALWKEPGAWHQLMLREQTCRSHGSGQSK